MLISHRRNTGRSFRICPAAFISLWISAYHPRKCVLYKEVHKDHVKMYAEITYRTEELLEYVSFIAYS